MLMLPVFSSDPACQVDSVDIGQILSAVRQHLGMEVSFVAEFSNGYRVFRHVDSAEGYNCIAVGASDPLEDSYCWWIAKGELPQLIQDPSDHPLTDRFEATRSLPVGAHLSVPIRLRDGSLYGTFCCFSTKSDRTLTDRDLATMEAFAELAAQRIQWRIDQDSERQSKLSRIRSIIARRDVHIHFQPAIRIDSPRIAFVEALARFRSSPYQPPDQWFAMAHEAGIGVELEAFAVKMALQHFASLPGSIAMSVNVSPDALRSREMLQLLVAAPLDRLIVEITEHRAVADYSTLLRLLQPLRERGLRLAVDDAGAGYASLSHILQLRPDILKLDMSLTRGIDRDPVRRALAIALVHFSDAIGSELVAEGVENPAELTSLRELGIKTVQGHLHARPESLEQLDLAAAEST